MNRPPLFPSLGSLPVLVAGALLASTTLVSAQSNFWKGSDGTGNSGYWDAPTHWSTGSVPISGQATRFDWNDTYTSESAMITISEGVEAKAGLVAFRHQKKATLLLEDGASLIATGSLTVGVDTNIGSTSAKIQGPDTGEAIVKIHRILATSNTDGRNTIEFSGQGLQAEQTGSYADFNYGSSLILSNGASLTALSKVDATEAGNFHFRATSTNGLNNRLILKEGSLSAGLIYAYAGALVQLSKDSTLTASSTSMSLYINHGSASNGARFELEGSGLDKSVTTRVYGNGILAIGLSDPDTGIRTGAGKLTLSSTVQLNTGSTLEISIFGSGNAGIDQIHLTDNTETKLTVSTGALLNLKLNGYTPTVGESWTVFTGETSKISRDFDLSLVDPTMWDLSNFNETGGWVIVSQIPEPSGAALLLLGGIGMIFLLRKLRHVRGQNA